MPYIPYHKIFCQKIEVDKRIENMKENLEIQKGDYVKYIGRTFPELFINHELIYKVKYISLDERFGHYSVILENVTENFGEHSYPYKDFVKVNL